MISKESNSYLRFLNLANALRDMSTFPKMDNVEESLLNAVVIAAAANAALSVQQAMGILPDVSPSTTHRRIKALRKSGLVELVGDPSDERIRYLMPTQLAKSFYQQMDECLKQAQT